MGTKTPIRVDDGLPDTVNIRTAAPTLHATAATVALSDSNASYSPVQMVVVTSKFHGETSMTSVLSMAQFQAAMQSNDPGALGSIEMNGQTWNVKDAIAGGTDSNKDNTTQPATAKKAIASASSAIAEAAISGADVAIAILQASTQTATNTDQDNDDGLQKESTTTRPPPTGQAASDATMSLSGSSNGMTVSVAVVAASAASTPTVASAAGVSLVA